MTRLQHYADLIRRSLCTNEQRPEQTREVEIHNLEGRILFDAVVGSVNPAHFVMSPECAVVEEFQTEPHIATQLVAPLSDGDSSSQLLAFPGAEGMGAWAAGGRGGDVYHVTNLDDAGDGSLRYGIENASGPRTIVFDVGGTIELQSRLTIDNPFLTIAGQTAPREGITITGQTVEVSNTHDIILRYLRIRPGDENPIDPQTHDGFAIRGSHDVIADHLSLSWGIDEVFATADSSNITLQWSIVSEGLANSLHPSGSHAYGSLNARTDISLHHNLFAHHNYRMPKIKGGNVDIVNNVFYDWATSVPTSIGSSLGNYPLSRVNIENNVYIAGPSIGNFDPFLAIQVQDASSIWTSGNVIDGNRDGTFNPNGTVQTQFHNTTLLMDQRFDFSSVATHSPELAYQLVLSDVGASIFRDAIDSRVIANVVQQSGSVIDSPTDVGGLVFFSDFNGAPDSDRDGIPDYWENSLDYLNPFFAADGNQDENEDGMTNLEEFLNAFAFGGSLRLQPPPSFTDSEDPNAPLGVVVETQASRNTRTPARWDESPWKFLQHQRRKYDRADDDTMDEFATDGTASSQLWSQNGEGS